mgnify:FL=1
MKSRIRRGFTIVELLIVVAVVAILAIVTATIYLNTQVQARDTHMRDGLDKFADAIMLWSSGHKGALPYGGSGTTYDATTQNCANPMNNRVEGWQDAGVYSSSCTIGDIMVKLEYLPKDFFSNLSKVTSKPSLFMVHSCTSDPAGRKFIVMTSLEDPDEKDKEHFKKEHERCFTTLPYSGAGTVDYFRSTYNMQIATTVSL